MTLSVNEIARNDPRLLQPLEKFAAGKINCVQAAIMPFIQAKSPELLGPALSLTKYLGGGIAGMGYVCGALLGAIMVLSRHLEEKGFTDEESEQRIREFSRQFGQQYGTVFCSGIKAQSGKETEYQACQVLVVSTIDSIDRSLANLDGSKDQA